MFLKKVEFWKNKEIKLISGYIRLKTCEQGKVEASKHLDQSIYQKGPNISTFA